MNQLLQAARLAEDCGLCVIPAAADGTKAPRPGKASWIRYQTERATDHEIEVWFSSGDYDGMGIICGAVSGGLECLELEGRAVKEGLLARLVQLAESAGLIDLLDGIADGFQETSPSGGIHWFYRISDGPVPGNCKLAERPSTPLELEDDPNKRKTLIETRGEGGFMICSPSGGRTHPSGLAWELELGGFDTIASITLAERDQIHGLCRMLDQMPEPVLNAQPPRTRDLPADEVRPGDDFNARARWQEVLCPHGWVELFTHGGITYWRRPGKAKGVSATTNSTGNNSLKVHTTSTNLRTDGTYDLFGAYAALDHNDSTEDAARALRDQGYGGKLDRTVRSSGRKRQDRTDTGTVATPEPGVESGLPVVTITNRELRDLADDLIKVLVEANEPPALFVRSGRVTRIRAEENGRHIIEDIGESVWRHRISRVCDLRRVNKDGSQSPTVASLDVVRDLVALGQWPFPPLLTITEVPTLRPDGSINQVAGYDPATRLVYAPDEALKMPVVPLEPTTDELAAAVDLVCSIICDFPFDSDADKANAIGLMLTPIVRPAIGGQVPLALLDAPEAGSGKGLLANVIAVICTGRPIAAQPLADREEEVRKMLLSSLMLGPSVIVLDNVEEAISSPSLAAVLTTDSYQDRLLGQSSMVSYPNRATWIATGNNITVAGDLARRTYRIRLDAHQARPYTRTGFVHPDLLAWVTENRGEILGALLTIARAWFVDGCPQVSSPAMGGFSEWASTIGAMLHHAGITGHLANWSTLLDTIDVEAAEWEAFFAIWHERWHSNVVTIKEVSDECDRLTSALKDVLPSDLARWTGTNSFGKRVGEAVRRRAGRHYGAEGFHLVDGGLNRQKVRQWSLNRRANTVEQIERQLTLEVPAVPAQPEMPEVSQDGLW